jgi:sugar lactone lactonase YvrE
MTELEASKRKRAKTTAADERLFVLDASGGQIFMVRPDGSDRKVIVTGGRLPDGIAIDVQEEHIYWTNMGVPNLNDGSIERVDFDGQNRTTIVPEGGTFTPKQIHLDKGNGKLYWCDREGMRVMRANLDGSHIETLIDSSQGEKPPGRDPKKWCVGITVDTERGQFYWTQKGPEKGNQGRLLRANTKTPQDQTAANRSDVEVLFDALPEPIDLELDPGRRVMYWTDRGDPPLCNTVNCAPLDSKPDRRATPQIMLTHLMEGIGIALDLDGQRMFVTDLAGSVYSARLDGTDKKALLFAQGNLTGIAYAEIPVKTEQNQRGS